MIRDYLGAVSTAATRKLPKGDRLLFVGRTRAALEAQVGPLASADDADAVAAALTALGDPDDLAAKERERLYSARRRGAAAEPPTLWKPPGKTSRRATPPGRPPRSGPAEPRSAGGPAESRPVADDAFEDAREGLGLRTVADVERHVVHFHGERHPQQRSRIGLDIVWQVAVEHISMPTKSGARQKS